MVGDGVGAVGGVGAVRLAVGREAPLLVEADDKLDTSADALAGGGVDELARLGLLVLDLAGQGLADLQQRGLEKIGVDLLVLRVQKGLDGGVERLDLGGRLALCDGGGLADGEPPSGVSFGLGGRDVRATRGTLADPSGRRGR